MISMENKLIKVYKHGSIAVIVPLIAFVIAYFLNNMLVLDYVHILLGALWTGVDIFLGLIFSSVIRTIGKSVKANIAKGMIPMTLFFIPAVSIIVPAAGYVLAIRENIFNPATGLFMAIEAIGIVLVATSFFVIVPFSWKFAKELSKDQPDEETISSSMSIISKGAFIQMFLQIAIIGLMAYMVVYPTNAV
ncbi:MAG: hypothetical protein ACYCSG_00505 [Thermoplasmataceae archaeon]